jgi:hypothetical protein
MPRFEIKGSGLALRRLSDAIQEALRLVRLPAQMKFGAVEISVSVSDREQLVLQAGDMESVGAAAYGLAEIKKCLACDDTVALLFDDAYLEHDDRGNVICCDCWRRLYG